MSGSAVTSTCMTGVCTASSGARAGDSDGDLIRKESSHEKKYSY